MCPDRHYNENIHTQQNPTACCLTPFTLRWLHQLTGHKSLTTNFTSNTSDSNILLCLLYSGCEQDTVACKRTWSELAPWTLHFAIAQKRNRRSITSSRTVPSGGNRDISYMAAGWVNHQQPVGNGGRPAPHHPIPGNMWTEGLNTAERPQKKKKNSQMRLPWWCGIHQLPPPPAGLHHQAWPRQLGTWTTAVVFPVGWS